MLLSVQIAAFCGGLVENLAREEGKYGSGMGVLDTPGDRGRADRVKSGWQEEDHGEFRISMAELMGCFRPSSSPLVVQMGKLRHRWGN